MMDIRYPGTSVTRIFAWIIVHGLLLALADAGDVPRYDPLRPVVKLTDILPNDYDTYQTPKINGAPAEVILQIEFLNIRSVNVAEMSFIADIFVYKTWFDPRLRFPQNCSLDRIALNPDWRAYLWTPDVYFHNAIEGKVQETIIPYVFLWLKNDSSVLFGARLSLQFSCDMLLHNFPHDTQTCEIIIKSLTHTLDDMNLHWNKEKALVVGDFIILPQFEYRDPEPGECKDFHKMGRHGEFACLLGIIKLTRRSGYYVINIYIPTILIVFMSMLTFWIPPDAVPGRVTLGVTSLLTIITKQYQASLPSVSYVVALNVWLSCCIGFVFCSLLEYAAVIALLSHQKRIQSESPSTSEKVRPMDSYAVVAVWNRVKNKVMKRIESLDCHNIDRMSRVIFPSVFALQCIAYWIHYSA